MFIIGGTRYGIDVHLIRERTGVDQVGAESVHLSKDKLVVERVKGTDSLSIGQAKNRQGRSIPRRRIMVQDMTHLLNIIG